MKSTTPAKQSNTNASHHTLESIPLKHGPGQIEITYYTPAIARIRIHPQQLPAPRPSEICVLAPDPAAQPEIELDADSLRLRGAKFDCAMNRRSGALHFSAADGRELLRTAEQRPFAFETEPVYRAIMDESTLSSQGTVDGERAQVKVKELVFARNAWRVRMNFDWNATEALYGLGSHEEDFLNLRGTMQYVYQHNRKVSLPLLLSTNGYGILFHTEGAFEFHDDSAGSFIELRAADELDFFFIYGPTPDEVIAGYRELTGAAPMQPKWLFGYCQSKERYQTQEEITGIAREFRRRKIPLDLIVQDWFYWPDGWGGKHFDFTRYPDPARLCADIHSLNMKVMISIWPNMLDSKNCPEMIAAGHMFNDHSIYNAFDEAARNLYWKQTREGIFQYGFDAWWCDSTEPYIADWQGATIGSPAERAAGNIAEFELHIDAGRINAYTLYHSKGIYEHQRAEAPARRVVNLTRSAWAGQQRYSTITWPGDHAASWASLAQHIPAALNFCAAGQPYYSMDIGAFFVKKKEQWFWNGEYEAGVDDLGYRELYTRWFQCGAFTPVFRAHGTDTPREPWRFGEPGTQFYDVLLEFIRLRYRLLPYIYALAGWVTQRHYTMMRPLAFDFPDDPQAHDRKDQFMFGPAFMACPVTQPMYYAAESRELYGIEKTRRVYLPAGCDWFDFWSGAFFSGGQSIVAPAPLEIMPLFVRAGSVIPLGPDLQYASEKPADEIDLLIFPGANGEFDLYEDAGENYDYEQGAFSSIPLRWHDADRILEIGDRQGSFSGMLKQRIFRPQLIRPGNGYTTIEQARGHAIPNDKKNIAAAIPIAYQGESVRSPVKG